ncbi:hypothetical protein [Streptomyces roseifaciens]|uniref:hypothetical protein n=1 Tax=Streptomyces roseifaciens TaxID=1488406 RepID=UPI0007182FA2|nr:hypothetical protein [Streptomyces roseifaciens]
MEELERLAGEAWEEGNQQAAQSSPGSASVLSAVSLACLVSVFGCTEHFDRGDRVFVRVVRRLGRPDRDACGLLLNCFDGH